MENFGLIKGPGEFLNEDTRKHFIGIRKHRFGFEGLVSDKYNAKRIFGDKVTTKKTT